MTLDQMVYRFLDVESTGLNRNDEVTQIAVITTDLNLKPLSVFSEYCFPNVPVSNKAEELSGLNRKKLLELSKGKTFEQIISEQPMFHSRKGIWVYYSPSNFDISIINRTLQGNGYKPLRFGNITKTLKTEKSKEGLYNIDASGLLSPLLGVPSMKLEMLYPKILKMEPEAISKLYAFFVNKVNMPVSVQSHNALFDAFILWLMISQKRKVLPHGT